MVRRETLSKCATCITDSKASLGCREQVVSSIFGFEGASPRAAALPNRLWCESRVLGDGSIAFVIRIIQEQPSDVGAALDIAR